MSMWGNIEPPASLEHTTLHIVTTAALKTTALIESVGEVLQCGLYEPIELLQGDCVNVARELTDKTLKAHPYKSVTFVSDQVYFHTSTSSHGGNGSEAATASTNSNNNNTTPTVDASAVAVDVAALNHIRDGVSSAVHLAQGWDACKRVRSSILLQQMLVSAKSMAAEVRKKF